MDPLPSGQAGCLPHGFRESHQPLRYTDGLFDPSTYGSVIASILAPHERGSRLMPLAPTGPLRGQGLTRIRGLSSSDLFAATPITAPDFADCVRSALFLYFSDLDESHTISQSIGTPTGSFLHGIMHRQEPDFGNAKYWFRRVGGHEVFAALREASLEALSGAEGEIESAEAGAAASLRTAIEGRTQWDPLWFVDQCEAAGGGDSGLQHRLQEIQLLEWQLLFDHCYRKATAAD